MCSSDLEEAKAQVVSQFVRGLELRPAPRSVLGEADVAVVVGRSYVPPPLEGSPPPTEADCPT